MIIFLNNVKYVIKDAKHVRIKVALIVLMVEHFMEIHVYVL